MALTLGPLLRDAGLDLNQAIAIRHAYTTEPDGIHSDSTDQEILAYTSTQSASTAKFLAFPPRYWVVFIREGGAEARLWSVVDNHGEIWNDGIRRGFDLRRTDHMTELRDRLVVGWRSPRTWWMRGMTAASYPVNSISDAEPIPFPGFDKLRLDYARLQAVMREPRYAAWTTALGAVKGVYLITDTRNGRQYVGKADGMDSIRQRWAAYAANGHGGNVELRGLDPSTFRFSLLRVFDPSTPTSEINDAESHYKLALDSRHPHGLNRN